MEENIKQVVSKSRCGVEHMCSVEYLSFCEAFSMHQEHAGSESAGCCWMNILNVTRCDKQVV